jgi:hypothetical protein
MCTLVHARLLNPMPLRLIQNTSTIKRPCSIERNGPLHRARSSSNASANATKRPDCTAANARNKNGFYPAGSGGEGHDNGTNGGRVRAQQCQGLDTRHSLPRSRLAPWNVGVMLSDIGDSEGRQEKCEYGAQNDWEVVSFFVA